LWLYLKLRIGTWGSRLIQRNATIKLYSYCTQRSEHKDAWNKYIKSTYVWYLAKLKATLYQPFHLWLYLKLRIGTWGSRLIQRNATIKLYSYCTQRSEHKDAWNKYIKLTYVRYLAKLKATLYQPFHLWLYLKLRIGTWGSRLIQRNATIKLYSYCTQRSEHKDALNKYIKLTYVRYLAKLRATLYQPFHLWLYLKLRIGTWNSRLIQRNATIKLYSYCTQGSEHKDAWNKYIKLTYVRYLAKLKATLF